MMADKNDELDELRNMVREMEDELDTMKNEVSHQETSLRMTLHDKSDAQRAISHITDHCEFALGRQAQQMKVLESTVISLIEKYSARLQNCRKSLSVYSRQASARENIIRDLQDDVADLEEQKKRWAMKREELESSIESSREASRSAEMALERKEMEKNELLHRLESSSRHRDLNTSMEFNTSVDIGHSEADGAIVTSAIQTLEELSRLAERVEEAEKRALDMSAQGARQFAKTTKTIAMLESDNYRQKMLVDHLRLVNSKLMGDIKAANAAGLQSNAMSTRFHMLEQELQEYMHKCAHLEAEIEEKDNALLEALEESQLIEDQRNRSFEEDIKNEQDRVMQLLDDNSQKDRTIRRLNDLNESLQHQVEKEIESAYMESERHRAEIQVEVKRAESAESTISSLRLQIVTLENEKSAAENSLEQMSKNHADKLAEYSKKKAVLESTISKNEDQIMDLQNTIDGHKATIRALEEDLMSRDSRIHDLTASMDDLESLYEDNTNRLRELEISLEKSVVERDQQEAKIADLTQYLDDARNQLETQDNELRSFSSKLQKSEEKIRKVTSEKHALEVVIEELRLKNESMCDTSNIAESKVDELQFDLQQSKNEIELLESEILDRKGELIHVKSQLESAIKEKSSLEKELSASKVKIEELKMKADKLAATENMVQQRDADLMQVSGSENLLIADMQAVMGRLEKLMHISRQNKSSGGYESNLAISSTPAGGSHSTHTGSNEMFDLLATPLKNLLTPSKDLISATRVTSQPAFMQSGGQLVVDTQLTELRHNFEKLVVMADEHLLRSAQLEESHRVLYTKLAESKRSYDNCDQKNRALLAEKSALVTQLEEAENEVRALNEELDACIEERDNALHAGEDHAQWIRLIRRDLEEVVESDEVIRTLTLTSTSSSASTANDSLAYSGALVESSSRNNHPLRDTIKQSQSTIERLCSQLRTLHSTVESKEHTLKKLEVQVISMQQKWDADMDKMQAKNSDLVAELEREHTLLIQTKADLKAHEGENAQLKSLVSEYSQQNLELEDDIKTSNETVSELRAALKEAEVLCVELRSRIRSLTTQQDELTTELATATNELTNARTKISNLEMQVEQWSADARRVKMERDNLLDLRNTLQSEVETARAEANVAMEKLRTRKSDDDVRASFELERLLAALGATLDNVCGASSHVPRIMEGAGALDISVQSMTRDRQPHHHQSLNSSFSSMDSAAGVSTIANRVEISVKRLTELRGLSRDEKRAKRQLEDKLQVLQHELEALKISTAQEKEEFRLAISEHIAKEKAVSQQLQYMDGISAQNVRLQDEINRLRQDMDGFSSGVDVDKKSLYGALSTVREKESELDHYKELLSDKMAECSSKADKIAGMESDIQDLKRRLDEKEESLRSVTSSGVRLQGTVDRLENSLERIKKEKAELEKKLKSAYDGGSGVVMSGSRVRELERELNEANRNHREAELELEEKILSLSTEKSDLEGRIASLEERLRQVSADSTAQRRENTLTAQELYRLQSRLDKEISDHKKTQAALQSVRHLEEDWRMQAEGTTAMMEEEELR